MKKILLFIIGGYSTMFLGSCNSNSKQAEPMYFSSSEAGPSYSNDETNDLSYNYDKINHLCDLMQEESNSFTPRTRNLDDDVLNKFLSAFCALTDAFHHAHRTKLLLTGIKEGDKVMSRLQDIDNVCYTNEKECQEGLDELNKYNGYLPSGMGDAWIAVLTRIKNYSSNIREQVQIIRNAQ